MARRTKEEAEETKQAISLKKPNKRYHWQHWKYSVKKATPEQRLMK